MANKSIQLNIFGRILMFVIAVIIIFAVYNTIRWGFGHTIAENTTSKEVAEFATNLSPYDSTTYYRLASIEEKSFFTDDLLKSLSDYEKALSVSPNDYRLWLALGKARERSGDDTGAEKALRKALELAPNYSEVHWTLGNTLLRRGNIDESFVQIRQAVENDPVYIQPAVVAAWQTFDGDVGQISQKIGDSTQIKAGLATFLAKQKMFDEAIIFWNSLPDQEKLTTYKTSGEEFLAKLIEAKKYREALNVQTQISSGDDEKHPVGNIFNGDFERDVKSANASIFDWQISTGQQPQIGMDDLQKHSGNRSLVLFFNSPTAQEFRQIQQTIVVEPGKTYKFDSFYQADLKALSTFKWEIIDANDGKVLGATGEAKTSSPNWAALTAGFTTSPSTQAIIVRLAQIPCKSGICPISGKIWFDDLSLK
jgi:tetratricopeptide (TPR) repeat protein